MADVSNVEVIHSFEEGFNPTAGLDALPPVESKKKSSNPKADAGVKAIANVRVDKLLKNQKVERTAEQLKVRMNNINLMQRYIKNPRFADYLQKMGLDWSTAEIKKMTDAEVEGYLDTIRHAVNNKQTSNFWTQLYFTGTSIVEGVTQIPTVKPRFDLLGLTAALQSNDEFLDTLTALELEYGDQTAMSAEKRLFVMTASAALQVAGMNKQKHLSLAEMKKKLASAGSPPPAAPQAPPAPNPLAPGVQAAFQDDSKSVAPPQNINIDPTIPRLPVDAVQAPSSNGNAPADNAIPLPSS
jgi:hypothetical protein